MEDIRKPADDLADTAKEYIEIKIDEIKLSTAAKLSLALGRIFTLMTIIIAAFMVLIVVSFGVILLIGEATGKYSTGAFIVAAAILALSAGILLFREKLFTDTFVKLFIRLLYEDTADKDDKTTATGN